jgi:tRNA (guanosine-2'-O-)-methyltransferase
MNALQGTALKRFLRDYRRKHLPAVDVVLVLQSVSYPVNVGSLFRIADAVRVREMVLCGATPTPPHPAITKVGRKKHRNVPWSYVARAEEAVRRLKEVGYHIIALEITDVALPYSEAEYPDQVCLLLGNEDHGVSRSVLDLCDTSVFVPMYGRGHSLNVHVCAAVVLYHLLHVSMS